MKITKFVHACLLVETPERTALFDPGVYSTFQVDALEKLDDIFITHQHNDHLDTKLVASLRQKFRDVRITAPQDALDQLEAAGVTDVSTVAPEGVRFFDSPHEPIRPLFDVEPPEELGFHYLGKLSHPGDSHSFNETMPVLALPIQAPWGSTRDAVTLGLALKPKYVIPIHDWHWSDEARAASYDRIQQTFAASGITFIKPVNGQTFEIDI